MATALYIADPTDANWPLAPTTKLVDLNVSTSTGLYLANDPDFGSVDPAATWLDSDTPGSVQATRHHGLVEMHLRLVARQGSYDALVAAVEALASALDPQIIGLYGQRMGVMVFQPAGASAPRYIDFYPSPLPQLLRGQARALYKVAKLLLDPDGVPVTVWRHPYFRRAKVAGTPTTVTNATAARHMTIHNPGTARSLTVVTAAPTGAAKLIEARIGLRATGNLTEYLTVYGFEVESATLTNTTTSVVDAAASGGNAAETTFSGTRQDAWHKRWRQVITVADGSSLQGRLRVVVALRFTDAGRYEVQLRWAAGNADPAESANHARWLEAQHINATDSALDYVQVDLGTIHVPHGAKTLVLEGWARRDADPTSTGGIRWDQVWLAPADEQHIIVAIPGHRGGASNPTHWTGDDLDVVAGSLTVKNHDVYLTAAADAVAWPGGVTLLPAGRYTVSLRASLRNRNLKRQRCGYLEVRKADTTLVTRVGLWSRTSLWEKWRHKPPPTVHFDADGATSYIAQVVLDAIPSGSAAQIVVHRLTQASRRYASSTESLVLDGTIRQAWLYTGVQRLAPLVLRGGYLELPPGDSVLGFAWRDAHSSGYDHIHPHKPLTKHVPTRSVSVTVDVYPRDLTL